MDKCPLHNTIAMRKERQRIAHEAMTLAMEALWYHNNVAAARQVLATARAEGRLAEFDAWYTALLEEDIALWEENAQIVAGINLPQGGAQQPVGDLHAFVLDNQNVHTSVVNAQTDAGLELLLATPVPLSQSTVDEIRAAWSSKPTGEIVRVANDMLRWYQVASCRETGDRLYRRALDGLWARAKNTPELVQRLWEEAVDSVGMCCDGHLSRLCNVMVGFDEAFKPQVSTGELLQQRMAALAAENIDVDLKVERAQVVFEELGIPVHERGAWIEAF